MEVRMVSKCDLVALVREALVESEEPEEVAGFVFDRMAAPAGVLSGIADTVSAFSYYKHPTLHEYDPL